MRADGNVLTHRQAGEWLHDLESAGDAAAGEAIRRCVGDVVAGVDDAAVARRQEAGDDREQGGLAGPVRTDQSGDAPRQSDERSPVQGEQTAEALGDILDLEQWLSHGRAPLPVVF
jgi:hypothetical protein